MSKKQWALLHKWRFLRMEINIPELSLILLIGVSGSGKSSFAKKHFAATEIISSDTCRGIVSNDENNQSATKDAFDVLYYITRKRLKNGLLTVIDATNVQPDARKGLIDIAKEYHCLPVAIVLDIHEKICVERNNQRPDRQFGAYVVRQQKMQLRKSLRDLKYEGFKKVFTLKSVEEVESITSITREKLFNDKKDLHGPFDIIGDVHGCYNELCSLLVKLGYTIETVSPTPENHGFSINHPQGRIAVFVGDLVDRGPDSPNVLRLVMSMVNAGTAMCVPGNHDVKLHKFLNNRKVQIKNGLEQTIQQLENESAEFKSSVEKFLYGLISHYIFDDGKLIVSHAGLKEELQGRASAAVREFCLYGETTGETDEYGLPVRHNWAAEYKGMTKVVYGHTPVLFPEWLNRTIDIDTGCVFGGSLTALRYPEEELVSVKAEKTYYESKKPLNNATNTSELSAQQHNDTLLPIENIIGKHIVQTRLRNNITINNENSIAALEIMSRFAINPKWLIYLPPTMSPCATSDLPDFLEYPHQALQYYKQQGVTKVICEEKHMGSRAIVVVCKNEQAVLDRFGIENEGIGICYTRTGRRFFSDITLEQEFIQRINKCLTTTGFWDEFSTDWVCLDAELMPWSAKAQSLLKEQYASVGAAAGASLPEVERALQNAYNRGIEDTLPLLSSFRAKNDAVQRYITSYQHYCWNVQSIDDYKFAPFHILATEGQVHTDKSHEWHMQHIHTFCQGDPQLFLATRYLIVDLDDTASYDEATQWWLQATAAGGEGMVVKPLQFIARGINGLVQPAIKCRGREYLRIIYGPEYDLPQNIERLKKRSLSRKQSLALREFALSIESLDRFVQKMPLRHIHECVFALLALESEEVDPRL